MANEDSDSEREYLLSLMANWDFDVDNEEEPEVNFQDIKTNIHTYWCISNLFAEKNQLMNNYASLRFENKNLEVSKENLEIFIIETSWCSYHKKGTGHINPGETRGWIKES